MSNRWVSGTIAGVALTDSGGRPSKNELLDAEGFEHSLVGNSLEALDLTVHTQLVDRGDRGVHFGVRVAQMPVAKRDAIVSAIQAAISVGNVFPVVLEDDSGADEISVLCVPDFERNDGKLYRREAIAAGFLKNVEFRFISVSHTL